MSALPLFSAKKRVMIEQYIQAYNAMDVEGMMENLDQTIEFEFQLDGRIEMKITGFREFREQAEKNLLNFSHRHQKIMGYRMEGNSIFVNIEFRGTISPEFAQSDNQILELKGTAEFVFFEGKIIQIIERCKQNV
jgi:hypothetical protein